MNMWRKFLITKEGIRETIKIKDGNGYILRIDGKKKYK